MKSELVIKRQISSFVAFWTLFHLLSSVILVSGYPTTKSADVGTFWQISDIHWDKLYSVYGDPKDMCHLSDGGNTEDFYNGLYGNFNCDSPWKLIVSAINAMKAFESNPDFILWTGDNAPHYSKPPYPTQKDISLILSNLTRTMAINFPNSKILPIIGNHDTFPADTISPNNNSIYKDYLTSGKWNDILPNTAWDTFLQGGYYSVTVQPYLKVLGLNTILWYISNSLTVNFTDPAGQLAWLQTELTKARKNNEKVYIVGHVPPGHSCRGYRNKLLPAFYHSDLNEKYLDIVNHYGDVIAGQFFGHLHYDTFGLFLNNEGEHTSSMLLSPSVTPWHSLYPLLKNISVPPNPSVRLYFYNHTDGRILDYEHYFLNLTKINDELTMEESGEMENKSYNETKQASWEKLYTFTETYNLADVTTRSLANLFENLKAVPSMFEKYYKLTSAGKDNGPCDEFCKKMHLCAISHIDHTKYSTCVLIPKNQKINNISTSLGKIHAATPTQQSVVQSSSRTIVIGCTLSLLVLIMILVVVYIKRTRMTKGPRFVRFQ